MIYVFERGEGKTGAILLFEGWTNSYYTMNKHCVSKYYNFLYNNTLLSNSLFNIDTLIIIDGAVIKRARKPSLSSTEDKISSKFREESLYYTEL